MEPDPVEQRVTMGVPKRSFKPHERRLPLHPQMLSEIPAPLRSQLSFEQGYGTDFGVTDAELLEAGFQVAPREEITSGSDVVLLPKPTSDDVRAMRPGATLWGWPHCVQDPEITQIAIDRGLTLLAFEAMFDAGAGGEQGRARHVFHSNNELAGFSSVTHALQLSGETALYGPTSSAAVIGFGATGQGAVRALKAQGFTSIYVLSQREREDIAPVDGVDFLQLRDAAGENPTVESSDGQVWSLSDFLRQRNVIVNCTLQDPTAPLVFLDDSDLQTLQHGTIVVDVSCDSGMGFSWARPTSFENPTFQPWPGVLHYGVDHSPSLYWKSATWELSRALLPFIAEVLEGEDVWRENPILANAVEIDGGVIKNPAILSHQRREAASPHRVIAG